MLGVQKKRSTKTAA
nr:32 kda histone analog [Chlamydia trachomatis, serotype L2, Peptide Partial, 14 aa] [Chlamydia trachomatis]AAB20185.1 27 kda histone analog [Chlamydia trachomatis, serotype D, Peptide Partial, 14 aa] [Chlamydia trachomatis]